MICVPKQKKKCVHIPVVNYTHLPLPKVELCDDQVKKVIDEVDLREGKCDLEAWRYISNSRRWPM